MRYWITLLLASLLLSGCGTAPANRGPQATSPARVAATAAVARELYEGKSPAVYGTQFPVASFAEGVERGDAAWRNGDTDLALYMYVQALAFDGPAADVFGKIGAIHEARGNLRLGVRAFELAMQVAPTDVRIIERLGLLYTLAGRDKDAEPLLEKVVAQAPTRWRAQDALGLLHLRRGDTQRATQLFDAALAVEPKAGIVFYHRGNAHLERSDEESAAADFRRALDLGEVRSGAAEALGRLVAGRREYADALRLFLVNQKIHEAYASLGQAALSNRDYAAAIRYFELAQSEAPSFDESAARNLALAREYQEQQRSAANDAGVAAVKDPNRVVLADSRVRANPSLSDPVVGFVRRDDRIKLLHCDGEWCLIEYHSRGKGAAQQGWMRSNFLGAL